MTESSHFETRLHFEEFPFHIGVSKKPINPNGFPDTFPFSLGLDLNTGMLRQIGSVELSVLLERAYGLGGQIGTPLDDTPFGKSYADDFLTFIKTVVPGHNGRRVLEIGAGRAYLSRKMMDAGFSVDALEPGKGYERHWDRHKVEVIQDTFPSSKTAGPYKAIIAFAVLEHIAEPEYFLKRAGDHLDPGGVLVLSVPDCTDEIEHGDPSMLLHEHFLYFTPESLERLLLKHGFTVDVIHPSTFGRSIFCAARVAGSEQVPEIPKDEMETLLRYRSRCRAYRNLFARIGKRSREAGQSLGIYCPSRALGLLPVGTSARFFDDDPELAGKFYPPFKWPVESRKDLLADPVDELWIMSRTFGESIATKLQNTKVLQGTIIRVVTEIVSDV